MQYHLPDKGITLGDKFQPIPPNAYMMVTADHQVTNLLQQ